MIEEHVSDLLPGFALGMLDEAELLQVARHLPHCPVCRAELASFWPVVDQLPMSVPLQTPPPQLKEKILLQASAAVKSSPALDDHSRPMNAKPPESGAAHKNRRRSLSGWLDSLRVHPAPLMFATIGILLVALLVLSSLFLWRQSHLLQAQSPGMRVVQLAGTDQAPQAQGYLMIFEQEQYGTLVVEDAPLLETGYQYQLWLIEDGKRTSGGVFSVDEVGYGTLQISAAQPLDHFASFGVTVEPAGGSPGPTGKKILGGSQ